MKIELQITLSNKLEFSVSHDVTTLGDLRKLLQKGDRKLATVNKTIPELSDAKLERARLYVEQPKSTTATAA